MVAQQFGKMREVVASLLLLHFAGVGEKPATELRRSASQWLVSVRQLLDKSVLRRES